MKGMLDPIFEEKVIGHAEVRQIFKASGVGNIAGSYVLDGVFERNCKVRITREGKQILYAHDTGIFPESTWKFLEGKYLDLASLDCTALSRDWRQGHMGFQAVDEVRDRLKEMGCIDGKTTLVLNHLAHYGDFTHEKICALENPKGYEVAYDGCSFEV